MGTHYGTFRTDTASGLAGSVQPVQSGVEALARRQQAVRDLLAQQTVEEDEEKSFLEKLILKYIPGPPAGTQYGDFQPQGGGSAATPTATAPAPAPRTSSRVPKRGASEAATGRGVIDSAYERYRSLFEEELKSDLAKLTRGYEDRIADLRDEIGGYQTGVGEINANYGEYTDEANRILGDVADLEAEPLGDSAVDEAVADSYDEYGGVLAENLNLLSSATPEMAAAMNEELRFMETAIEDGLRSKTMSQSEMHRLASVNASALATLVWKDDIFNAERSRFQMEVQIEKAISDRQDELADVQRDMARAIQDRRDEQGEFNVDPDDLWNAAARDFLTGVGLDDNERQDIMSLWDQIFDLNPQAKVDFDTFKGMVNTRINEENLRRMGIFDKITALRNSIRGTPPPQDANGNDLYDPELLDAKIVAMISSPNLQASLQQLTGMAKGIGLGWLVDQWGIDDFDYSTLEDINSSKFQSMFDMWGVHKEFRTEYNDFIENQNAGYTSGGQAANNYANRNKSEYVYRRETTAPYFADALKRQFPGVEIGALGYIRDVNDVGGARAVNSDHQSGGAIDVYWKRGTTAEKNAKMAEINAWLRRQGGVSFTNWYDGKSHVHVSFNLGWRVPV